MLIIVGQKQFEKQVAALHADAMKGVEKELSGIRNVSDLTAKVRSLRDEVETLEIEKARKEEEFERREREIEHKIGLERQRQEFELEHGKAEAVLEVREENLAADKERFAAQMEFQSKRFTEEVGYLKDMIGQVLERVPNVTAAITPTTRRR